MKYITLNAYFDMTNSQNLSDKLFHLFIAWLVLLEHILLVKLYWVKLLMRDNETRPRSRIHYWWCATQHVCRCSMSNNNRKIKFKFNLNRIRTINVKQLMNLNKKQMNHKKISMYHLPCLVPWNEESQGYTCGKNDIYAFMLSDLNIAAQLDHHSNSIISLTSLININTILEGIYTLFNKIITFTSL